MSVSTYWTWIPLTVVMQPAGTTTTPAQTIDSFTASTTSITQGQSVTLNWTTSNATAVTLITTSGDVTTTQTVANSGSQAVTPSANTTYTLQAAGSAATVSSAPINVTVTVAQPVDTSQPQGTVVQVGTNTIRDVAPNMPSTFCEFGALGPAGVVSNGSHAFAPNLGAQGSIIVTGGGHDDYGGNEVYAYDIATKVWTRLSDYSTSPTSQTDPNIDLQHGELPDGSAMTCHTFNVLTVIPGGTNNKGLLLRVAAPSLGIGNGAQSSAWAQAADLGVTPIAAPTVIWKRFSTNACTYNTYASSPVPSFHTYDQAAGKVYGGYAGGFHALFTVLDLATKTFSMLPVASSNWGFMPVAAAHPVQGLMVWIAGYGPNAGDQPMTPQLMSIKLADPSGGAKQLTTTGDVIPQNTITALNNYLLPYSLDWDTANNVGYVTLGDQDRTHLWRITPPTSGDPQTQAWTITKIAIPSLPLLADSSYAGSNLDSLYGHWRYCPSIKAFAWVGKTSQKIAFWYTP